MTLVSPYPLQWPDGVKRTPRGKWAPSPFRTGYAKAIDNVVASLRGFQRDSGVRIDNVVLSSNRDLMGRLLDNDPGVAAWFQFEGQWVAFAVDRFGVAEANVQAIHHIIEARRTELRYGGLAIVRQTFRSFTALPAPGEAESARWWKVLHCEPTASPDDIRAAYRRRAAELHPDKPGGSAAAMAELNVARDVALKERGAA